jgi:hypothetical protein
MKEVRRHGDEAGTRLKWEGYEMGFQLNENTE